MKASTLGIFAALTLLVAGGAYTYSLVYKAPVQEPATTGTGATTTTETYLPYGDVTLKLGEVAQFKNLTIRPTSIVEDSRCPVDVQCIQAGTVRVKVEVISGMGTSTNTIKLNESVTTEAESILFARVLPASKNSKVKLTDQDYAFVFTVTEKPAAQTEVKIALLDTTGQGSGKSVGCDTLVLAPRTVAATTSVLTAALQALFKEPATPVQPSTNYNFIARTNATLKFDHATVVNGTANIYLTGQLSGLAGVCDDPRAKIQIEETAKQFATVQKVQIYLNNKPTTLTPSEKGE